MIDPITNPVAEKNFDFLLISGNSIAGCEKVNGIQLYCRWMRATAMLKYTAKGLIYSDTNHYLTVAHMTHRNT